MPYLRGMAYVFYEQRPTYLEAIPETDVRPVGNKIIFKYDGVQAGPEHKASVYRLAAIADGHGTHDCTAMVGRIAKIGNAGGKIAGSRTQLKVFPVFAQQVVKPYREGKKAYPVYFDKPDSCAEAQPVEAFGKAAVVIGAEDEAFTPEFGVYGLGCTVRYRYRVSTVSFEVNSVLG